MSDFDDIIKGLPEGPSEGEKLENIWQAVEALWPEFYEGVLVKGVLMAEYVDNDGERVLRYISSPNTAPWDALGMLESARGDARDLSRNATFMDDDDFKDDDE
jgi:hypothetical protein